MQDPAVAQIASNFCYKPNVVCPDIDAIPLLQAFASISSGHGSPAAA